MLDRILGVGLGLAAIGSGVYALVAVLSGLPPADWVCALEARYAFGGSYRVIEAWAVTWFHLLAALAAPLALATLVSNLRTRDPRPDLEGTAAARFRSLSRKRLVWGAAIALATISFYLTMWLAPSTLAPVSFLARVALVLGPFATFVGPALLLDALLRPSARRVVVHQLAEQPGDGERRSLNGVYSLEAREAASLRVGTEVSVLSTRIFATVLTVTVLDPYR